MYIKCLLYIVPGIIGILYLFCHLISKLLYKLLLYNVLLKQKKKSDNNMETKKLGLSHVDRTREARCESRPFGPRAPLSFPHAGTQGMNQQGKCPCYLATRNPYDFREE